MVASPKPVFISYARRSSRDQAVALHRALTDAGVAAFLDTSDIETGERFPEHLTDALLRARLVVVFADSDYFRRWYCLAEYEIALAPYRAVERAGDEDRRQALERIVIALPAGPVDRRVTDSLPPILRTTDWPAANQSAELVALATARVNRISTTFAEALGTAAAADIRRGLIERSGLPPPAPLTTVRRLHPDQVPGSLHDAFIGRADELWQLQHLLFTVRGDPAAQAPTGVLVQAGPGFGKTQLAAEYFHRFGPAHYHGGLFWVDATVSDEQLQDRLHGILRTFNPQIPDSATFRQTGRDVSRELVEAVRALPADQPVLWVVDNLPESESDAPPRPVETWCPVRSSVSLLITSRSDVFVTDGVLDKVTLDVLAPDRAVMLLTQGQRVDRSALDEDAWMRIASWVGFLPLALTLLNKSLATGASPVTLLGNVGSSTALGSLGEQMKALSRWLPSGSVRGVTEAFEVSYRALPELAWPLAHLLAQFAPDPIPESLVPASLADLPRRELLNRSFVVAASATEKRAVRLLGRMHRLMSEFLRARSPDSEADLHAAVGVITSVVTPDACRDPARWPLMNACAPHVRVVMDSLFARRAAEDALGLGSRLLSLFLRQGRHEDALAVAEETASQAERILGPMHRETLRGRSGVAAALRIKGDFSQSAELASEILDAQRRTLPKDDADTLWTMANLAAVYCRLGKHEASRALRQDVYDVYRREAGPTDLNTLTALGQLALALWDVEDFTTAATYQREILAFHDRGRDDDPIRLRAMSNLANTLYSLGEYGEALDLHAKVASIRARALPPDHRDVLRAISNVGELERCLHRREAIDHHTTVLEGRRRTFAPGSPDVLWAVRNLSRTLRDFGEIQKAEELEDELRRSLARHPHVVLPKLGIEWDADDILP